GDTGGLNIIEAPFIGAHADIGGGNASMEAGGHGGDLSDVALNWMVWQARAVAARFGLDATDRDIAMPVLHDERSPVMRSIQDGDRSVLGADGNVQHAYQDEHSRLGAERRAAAETLIARYESWRTRAGSAVGTVDMDGYARWLHDELGWRALPE